MGKKNKSTNNLGRSLIKDRFGSSNKARRTKDSSLLHTAEVADGYDWGRLNLQSVTEESSFQEFLSTAELAGTEFQAEKLNITFVNPKAGIGILSREEKGKVKETQDKNKQFLGIPRRPKWDENTTAEQLQTAEREHFLEWRRRLAVLQEVEGVLLTPYEKNLEFWRQLWRVVEKSDVVVQIVDARNPLLFRCQDLEQYVLEVSPNKMNLILLNKSDFLSTTQRRIWADYFGKLGIHVAFFSATHAAEQDAIKDKCPLEPSEQIFNENEYSDIDSECVSLKAEDSVIDSECVSVKAEDSVIDSECVSVKAEDSVSKIELDGVDKEIIMPKTDSFEKEEDLAISNLERDLKKVVKFTDVEASVKICDSINIVNNSETLLSREELISFFRGLHTGPQVTPGITTIGLVGYPNVGKSSTINTLLMHKKVSVSATPGKTKHFQTLFLDDDLLLCDCPGLVMPSFVFTKAEMVVNGILPIDQMRDHVPPVTLVSNLIPRHVLEETYKIMLPQPDEGEDPLRTPTAEELLNAYGYSRGFMTQNGQPDNPRSARYVLKDFVNGKLLYCHAPPNQLQEEYHIFLERVKPADRRVFTPAGKRVLKSNKLTSEDLNQVFFKKASPGMHNKGASSSTSDTCSSLTGSTTTLDQNKPWKNHHNKRNKREKLRRVYAHLDQ